MTGLIEEIQRDAIDPDIPVATLLRKVKLAAAKLKLENLAAWVESELNGYDGAVPEYRKLSGQPKALNPYHGWIPIHMDTAEHQRLISLAPNNQSVAELTELVSRTEKGSTLHRPLAHSIIQSLNKGSDFPLGEMSIFLSRADVVGILDTVRNKVLDWAIEMEKAGISGEGLTFTVQEQSKAQAVPQATYHIGSIGTFTGVLGDSNKTGGITSNSFSISQVTDLTKYLRHNMDALVAAGADKEALEAAVTGMELESARPQPDTSKLGSFASDVRMALSGAAGEVMASGALAALSAVFGA